MKAEQIEQVKQKIVKKISQVEEDITDLTIQAKPISPENAIGRLSRMDAINNKSVIEASLRSAIDKLAGLKHSLERIADEDFGLCASCREPIQFERILFMPESSRCVKCSGK